MRWITWLICGVVALGLSGCDLITGPDPLDGPYYYYHGSDRINVTIDRIHIIALPDSGSPLSEEHFGIEIVRRFGGPGDFEVFELVGGLRRVFRAPIVLVATRRTDVRPEVQQSAIPGKPAAFDSPPPPM
jgi:hypothetical protein